MLALLETEGWHRQTYKRDLAKHKVEGDINIKLTNIIILSSKEGMKNLPFPCG